MAKERRKKQSFIWNTTKVFFVSVTKLIWNIIKIPYYIYKLFSKTKRKIKKTNEKRKITQSRENIKAKYSNFKILKENSGSFKTFEEKNLFGESTVGIILGARGTGKSAIGIKILENLHSKNPSKKISAFGFKEESLPSWISSIDSVEKIENNSHVLVDEGGILFSSRSSMSNPNKLLSKLILISRHKNISIIFISQNSSNLEVNILRQADYLVLKPSSLLQKDFERKIIQKIYQEKSEEFKSLKDDKGLTYIHSDAFQGFISNPLPSFWKKNLSKSFK